MKEQPRTWVTYDKMQIPQRLANKKFYVHEIAAINLSKIYYLHGVIILNL